MIGISRAIQYRRDQETRDHEEEVHADRHDLDKHSVDDRIQSSESAGGRGQETVMKDHGENRDAAQPIDRGNPGE